MQTFTLKLALVGVVLLLLNVKDSIQQNNNTRILRAATIIYRHGERNPIKSYPGDLFRNETKYWPEGYGALTTAGKVKLYNLGWYMRKRYPTFQRKNVVVYTSDQNRTITSAMSNLAGFYGQNRSFLKHVDSFNPRGLGIKVIPKNEDDFILIDHGKPCPKYDQLQQEYFKETRPMEKYKDAVNIIHENTGLNFSTFNIDLVLLADTILIQKSRNFQLQQWIEDLYKDDIFYEIRDEFFLHIMPTFELKRLRTGAMIKRFLNEMDQVVNAVKNLKQHSSLQEASPQTEFPKITIISGHDSTLADWMIDLDVFDWDGPPFGAAIFMELYEEPQVISNSKHNNATVIFSIKVFYKNDSENEPVLMNLPGCPTPCYYSKFKKMLQPLLMTNREQECQVLNSNKNNNNEEKQVIEEEDGDDIEDGMSVHLSDTDNNTNNNDSNVNKISKPNNNACMKCSGMLIYGSLSLIMVLCNTFNN